MTDLVLAISAMHLSNKLGRYTHIATEYYVSALGSLRSMVDGGEIEGSEDWLMLMVIMLCLYEVCPEQLHFSYDLSKSYPSYIPSEQIAKIIFLPIEMETRSGQQHVNPPTRCHAGLPATHEESMQSSWTCDYTF